MRGSTYLVYQIRASSEEMPFYIGKTYLGSNRFWCHLRTGKKDSRTLTGKKIRKIIRDGGEVLFEVLHSGLSEEESFKIETQLIKRYGRRDNGTGFLTNHTWGGEGTSGLIVSDATRKKKSLKSKGVPRPENVERFSKEVTAFSEDGQVKGVYSSGREACKQLGLTIGSVSRVLHNPLLFAQDSQGRDYRFKLGRHSDPIPPRDRCKSDQSRQKVSAFNDSGEKIADFPGGSDAAKFFGISRAAVSRSASQITPHTPTRLGYVRFTKDTNVTQMPAFEKPYVYSGQKEVIQMSVEGTEISRFPSVAHAAKELGLDRNSISKCALGKTSKYKGFIWKYTEDKDP